MQRERQNPMSEPSSKEERSYQYASSYFYFLKSLKILALDALDQCEEMGYFNVAWELREDMLRNGQAILNSSEGDLSDDERSDISSLLENLKEAPHEVVSVDNLRESHLASMSNPYWAPLRTEAKRLIDALSHETQRTSSVLWPAGTNASGPDG
jgi:hypothetical protein